jgi:hypothetical protein
VELEAENVAELSGRPLGQLKRRDVAIALLSVSPNDALASLPGIRRGLLAAGNPLSAAFWDSAETVLHKIKDHQATFGDVHGWLEATGTEPTGMIGLHVWEEPSQRSPLQQEMHALLVSYLEDCLATGEIDPDKLVTGDPEARRDYLALQEQWMTAPLPDGRVPMTALLDEQDEAFLADWAAADAEALSALRSVLERVGERPLPTADLRMASRRLREDIGRPGWPGQMLVSFSGRTRESLPADDAEMWLTLATSVASPQGDPLTEEDKEFARAMEWAEDDDLDFGALEDGPGDDEDDGELDEMSAAMAAVCALDHFDWLAVISALATGGPGTPASAADLARYVREFDAEQETDDDLGDEDDEDDESGGHDESGGDDGDVAFDPADFDDFDDFDELSVEGLFLHVTAMWSVLGAIDEDDRLTPLGWWGLPEAMQRAWTES